MRRLHNSTASINNDYLFTTGRLHKKQQDSTKVDLSAGLGNDFNFGDQLVRLSSHKGFPTFWQAEWLKRNVQCWARANRSLCWIVESESNN